MTSTLTTDTAEQANKTVGGDKNNTADEQKNLRQADFKTALVLFFITIALIGQTLGFPMSGSYGGVENQWYVSPALFPLMVLSLLLLCSVILLINALKEQGTEQFFNIQTWLGSYQCRRIQDRWYVILVLCCYVYIAIPTTDFYLATVVFLFALVSRFYLAIKHSLIITTGLVLLFAIGLILIKTGVVIELFVETNSTTDISFFEVNQDADMIKLADIFSAVIISLYILINLIFIQIKQDRSTEGSKAKEQSKRIAKAFTTVFIVPLTLVIIFSYLLNVPMPVEYGSVISALDILVYDVLEWH